jgi:hypothetical protein
MELVAAFVFGIAALFALARPETLEEQAERLAKQEKHRRARA